MRSTASTNPAITTSSTAAPATKVVRWRTAVARRCGGDPIGDHGLELDDGAVQEIGRGAIEPSDGTVGRPRILAASRGEPAQGTVVVGVQLSVRIPEPDQLSMHLLIGHRIQQLLVQPVDLEVLGAEPAGVLGQVTEVEAAQQDVLPLLHLLLELDLQLPGGQPLPHLLGEQSVVLAGGVRV